ncbi:MAG TPA: FMN-binding negative transcriptional regulator [Actinophytocola sp.]|uniref:FMN-binding negative transcriptional regulator n=1 Tax=Actinophytocola sp. TaxID=1872138 RepID=UPI002DB67396|nr:FMN-binding negative transcriptional regulator [Actinophytocola sp.]HEU5471973.1 FMN-binding negative transcriptional regulator [Actinophytocola sp.]
MARMFVPGQYREPDGSWMVDIVRQNPLALLVTDGPTGDVPFATHLPVIPESRMTGNWPDDLSGVTLLGHMNRANPHWQKLENGASALLVFTGPHAYVSPTVYQTTPAAPTWNFTSVHVHGTLTKIDSRVRTLAVVMATVRAFEAEFGAGWDMAGSIEHFLRILPGVGAFQFTITKADGMFKLSQEQPPQVQERVRTDFAERDSTLHRDTADLMSRLPEPKPAVTLTQFPACL